MKITPRSLALIGVLLAGAAGFAPLHAQESLLWKATNPKPAAVVPQYGNQVSPFPTAIRTASTEFDEEAQLAAEAERSRLRDEAVGRVKQMISSGSGFEPMLRQLQVGGTLNGLQGPRVLINNQWVGVGSTVDARQMRTQKLAEELQNLANIDPATASEMGQQVQSMVIAGATIKLSIKQIAERSLTLAAPSGQTYTLQININNK